MKKLLAVVAFVVVLSGALSARAETLTETEKNMPIAKRTEIRLLIEDLGNYREAQVKAIDKLVEIGSDAVPILLRYVRKCENENIRANICIVLGRIGDPEAIPAIGALLADESQYVRFMAQEGLRLLAHADNDAALMDVVDYLREKVKVKDDSVRSLAVEVLVDLNPADLWEDILGLLKDPYWKVRADAAKALGGISTTVTVEQQGTICNALMPLFSDKSPVVRRSAAIAGGFYLSLSSMYVLPDEDEDGKFKGFKASPNLGVVNTLADKEIALLSDPDEGVRTAAGYALGNVWTTKAKEAAPKVMAALIKALDDKSAEVRMAAAASLGRIGDKSAVDALIAHLDEDVPLVLNVIVEALRRRTLKNFGFQPYEILDESPDNPIDTLEKYKEAKERLAQKRKEAIDKWKQWWAENKDTFEVNEIIR